MIGKRFPERFPGALGQPGQFCLLGYSWRQYCKVSLYALGRPFTVPWLKFKGWNHVL